METIPQTGPAADPEAPRSAASRILIVDDDPGIRDVVSDFLGRHGYAVDTASDARTMEQVLARGPVDLVVLDIMLPGEDGLAIARRLRAVGGPPLGIILLTARGTLEDRLEGLRDGADVYFVKPVDLRELAFAVRNLHRRVSPPSTEQPAEGGYTLDTLHSQLNLPSGEQVVLTATELRILQALALKPGEVVERVDLLKSLRLPMDLPGMQRLETQISRLRSKVRQLSGSEPLPLHARHGVGYAFLANLRLLA